MANTGATGETTTTDNRRVLQLMRLSVYDLSWPPSVTWSYIGWRTFKRQADRSMEAWVEKARRNLCRKIERRYDLPKDSVKVEDLRCIVWFDAYSDRMWCWGELR